MPKVVSADTLNDHYIAYVIEAPEIASRIEPGQLLEVGLGQAAVVPYVIADFSRDKGTVTVVARKSGDEENGGSVLPDALDLRGPIGQKRAFKSVGKILCVAEGLGVAGLYKRLQELRGRDIYTVVIAGFKSKDHVYWIDRLDSVSTELYVVTEDGSYGIRGPIKNTIRGVCENELDIDRALAIGSLDLLKTCCGITGAHGIPTIINLNAVLIENAADVTLEGVARVHQFDWSTASDLDGHAVDFDDLTQRLGISITR